MYAYIYVCVCVFFGSTLRMALRRDMPYRPVCVFVCMYAHLLGLP
jgi:hypothetical protein